MSGWVEHARAILSGAVQAMDGVDRRPALERALHAAAPTAAFMLVQPGASDAPPPPSAEEQQALRALAGAAWRSMTDELQRQALSGVPAALRSAGDADKLARRLLQQLPRGTTLGARLRKAASASAAVPGGARAAEDFTLGPVLRTRRFGQVLQAFDRTRARPVDLWVFRPELISDAESREHLIDWLQRTIAAAPPLVVAPRELVRGAGLGLAAVTDVGGRTLQEVASKAPLSAAKAVAIARALIASVSGSGTRQALVPDLVGVGGAGGARFVVEPPDVRPGDHARLGQEFDPAAAYLPPEAIEDVSSLDERSLVYGVGALLSLMLTGRAPFQGRTALQLFMQIRDGLRAPLDPAVPALLRVTVDRAMARTPADRFQGLTDLDRVLAQLA